MCKLCYDSEKAKELIKKYRCQGVQVGKTDVIDLWEDSQPIRASIWYDNEGKIKKRQFLLELEMTTSDDGNGVRLLYPIKYCPKCNKELK